MKAAVIPSASEWWKTNSKDTEVFSTADFTEENNLYVLIQGLYQEKSKYEL